MIIRKIINKLKYEREKLYWNKCYWQTLYANYDKTRYTKELAYLKEHGKLQKGRGLVFPYEYIENYQPDVNKVAYDEKLCMPYANWHGKRLFYPGGKESLAWVAKKVANRDMEQDVHSPHRYFAENFPKPSKGEIFVDVGAAEGEQALDIVESVDGCILIENSEGWVKALQATFAPWKNKVKIIKAFASDYSSKENGILKLDDVLEKENKYCLKMDVEGAEMEVLRGAEESLKRGGIRLAVCVYHKSSDEREICNYLTSLGYSCSFSEGYCLIFSRSFQKFNRTVPLFRKGVLRAYKERVIE